MTIDLIEKIKKAEKIEDVISISDFKSAFTSVIKEIHPDICSLEGAAEATAKMNLWKDYFENGKEYKDDIGPFKTNGYWADFKSTEPNLNWSIENYRLFTQLQTDADKNFQRYLPKECILMPDGSYRFKFEKRAIPISDLTLPQEHINWILNRLLEYCAYLSEIGFVHCGLTPESVFIVPETHGIQIISFYHLTRFGNKVKTISGKRSGWYPTSMFNDKVATPSIDLELAKRTAAYLLGDKSGSGINLRKTHNEKFINFLTAADINSYKCLTTYRQMIKDNFKKEFHLLTI